MSLPSTTHVWPYPREQYPFAEELQRLFQVADLTRLHDHDREMPEVGDHHKKLQGTRWHRRFYHGFFGRFSRLYTGFILYLRRRYQLPPRSLIYQRVPTLRVQFPGDLAVGEFHTDAQYGHSPGEINFWLPLTAVAESQSVWIETEAGKGDYQPQPLAVGEVLVFDGARLRHGNRANATGSTRVSIDFRLGSRVDLELSGASSASAGKVLGLGDYFAVM